MVVAWLVRRILLVRRLTPPLSPPLPPRSFQAENGAKTVAVKAENMFLVESAASIAKRAAEAAAAYSVEKTAMLNGDIPNDIKPGSAAENVKVLSVSNGDGTRVRCVALNLLLLFVISHTPPPYRRTHLRVHVVAVAFRAFCLSAVS